MPDLISAVKKVCTGKAVANSSSEVLVYDCPHWRSDSAAMLRILRPNAYLTVEHCATSLSGFVLVICEPKGRFLNMRIVVAMSCLLSVLLWLLSDTCWLAPCESWPCETCLAA